MVHFGHVKLLSEGFARLCINMVNNNILNSIFINNNDVVVLHGNVLRVFF